MSKTNKNNEYLLPSRNVLKSHGCEARKTMLYNIQTDLYPNGLSEADLQKPFVGVVTAWNGSLHLVI